jgi:PAS domain S-box-containing protein
MGAGLEDTTVSPSACLGHRVLAASKVIAECIASPPPEGLRGQLQRLAMVLSPPGVAIAALDEDGEILAIGLHGLELLAVNSDVDALSMLGKDLQPYRTASGWQGLETSALGQPEGTAFEVLPIRDDVGTIGMIISAIPLTAGGDAQLVQEVSLESRPLLAAAIRSFLQGHAWRRIEQLRDLAQVTLDCQPWDFQGLVDRLAQIFDAGAVTLMLHEHGELRLAASTDRSLAQANVAYQRGQGLSGHVFKTARALRIHDTKDREEVRRITGLDRHGPSFPETDPSGVFTHQFLGVPLRLGKPSVGVVRISRRRGMPRFTREDESTLQLFADLLGAALAPAWDLLVRRSILETTTEAIAVSRRLNGGDRPVWQIVQANPGAERLLGRKVGEIVGMDTAALLEDGEFDRVRDELRPALERARAEGHAEVAPFQTRLKRGDGTLVPVSISYRILINRLVDPPTAYIIGIARDLSEIELRAEQHRRLLELLGAMKIAYFLSDPDGKTKESTPMDEEITGYSRQEIMSQSRTVLYGRLDYRKRLLNRVRRQGGQLWREIVPARRKGGERFYAEMDVRVLRDPTGREIGIEGFYRDVTDRLKLQGFVNADTDRTLTDDELFTHLKRDAEFHLDYISSLSHQLIAPLHALIGTLKNFELREISHEELLRQLPYVIGQAVVCTRLVRNLSYLDKILRGEPFERERVSLLTLALDTKREFAHLLEQKSLALSIDGESLDRNLAVLGHREMLRQVFINLIDNATKYSLPGTSIHVRGRSLRGLGVLEVSNKGLEISEGELEAVFQRGYRTKGAQELVPHGTGLGLWLVRKILEAHRASIRCLVRYDRRRTLFQIAFPRR